MIKSFNELLGYRINNFFIEYSSGFAVLPANGS